MLSSNTSGKDTFNHVLGTLISLPLRVARGRVRLAAGVGGGVSVEGGEGVLLKHFCPMCIHSCRPRRHDLNYFTRPPRRDISFTHLS